jgi:hypothetical protein
MTVQELIKRLADDYDPAETVVYTLYSESDLSEQNDEAERKRIWEEIAPELCSYMESTQSEIGDYLEELEVGA